MKILSWVPTETGSVIIMVCPFVQLCEDARVIVVML